MVLELIISFSSINAFMEIDIDQNEKPNTATFEISKVG